jgi:5'/3'-nucleotidase
MENKPLILISNDDGVTSKGIRLLVNIMKEFGDVMVVAPNSPQSGMGHAITIGETLRLYQNDLFEGVESYECSGTPADCIKLAKHHLLRDRNPDLVVSGINHGSNTSINVLYSGTMSAAIEAAVEGLPAIGFSVCEYDHKAILSHCESHIRLISERVLAKGIPKGMALNVNFPKYNPDKNIKGIKICRQAEAKWKEEFVERVDPQGKPYFWLTGNFVDQDNKNDTDEWAINNNYTSLVPCRYDLTIHESLEELKSWF